MGGTVKALFYNSVIFGGENPRLSTKRGGESSQEGMHQKG